MGMNNVNFVAIDLETATSKRTSACQIGIVVVKKGQIEKEISTFIKPPGNRYSAKNISIHHITPEKTADSPTMDIVWDEIRGYIDRNFIVGHNVSFDIDVLRKSLGEYNIQIPIFMGTACTCEITRWMSLEKACEVYDIPMADHHDALCDAEASAKLFIKYLNGEIDPEAEYDELDKKDKNSRGGYEEPVRYHEQIRGNLLKKDLTGANPDSPFYDKKVVITGVFSIDRTTLAIKLKSMGADIDSNITKRTNFVIIGKDPGPKKLEKIANLNADGYDIKEMYEPELLGILSKY